MRSVVIGATGIVGSYIVDRLVRAGERPIALSRSERKSTDDVEWFEGDLAAPERLKLPPFKTLYCTAHVGLLATALPFLSGASLTRVVAFTSTSIVTKMDRIIERLGFMPLAGSGSGLRQPVHAEDLAIGALAAAASSAAANKIYAIPGRDTITYREMVGRIFDGLQRPRRVVAVPPALWRAAFALAGPFISNANVAMGNRMAKDMIFDPTPAIQDFGWNPREFRPKFK